LISNIIAAGEKDAFLAKQTVYADDKIKMKLSEGMYIIRVKVKWVDGGEHEFTLNTLSPSPVVLKEIKGRGYENFLDQVYADCGKNLRDRYDFGHKCEFGSGWCGHKMYFYCLNNGKETWNCEINFDKLEGLKLSKAFKTAENQIRIRVPPHSQAVAYAKRISSGSVKINWKFNNTWEYN